MSAKVQGWVWDLDLAPQAKLLLLWLANRATDAGVCFPTTRCGMPPSRSARCSALTCGTWWRTGPPTAGVGDFPYGTFPINVTGAFVIGVFLALISDRLSVNPLWRLFFATGFLGGYTTFSSYTWEALILAQTGAWMRAGAYVLGSNAVGLIGVWVGASLTRLLPF